MGYVGFPYDLCISPLLFLVTHGNIMYKWPFWNFFFWRFEKNYNGIFIFIFSGSLPPSPADSGVSDVDSSSSGHTSNDELKARLQPGPGKIDLSRFFSF